MAAVHSGGHGPGFKDLIGQTFDRLTVLRFAGNRIKSGGKKGNALWDCVCVCGTERRLAGCDLTGGHTRSCGCLHHELQADRMRKASYRHGAAVGGRTTAEYRSHQNMLRRCYAATHQDYLNYGGRGIEVCVRWKGPEGFANFLADMGKSPGRSYSLGRRDNNAGYSPENCSWETMRQQQNNRRSNRLLMWQGRTQTVMQWARELNLSAHTIYGRLNRGWTVERALITPPR